MFYKTMLTIYIMIFACSSFLANAEVFTMTPTHLHLRGQCDEDTCNTWTVKLKATDGQEQIAQLKEAMFQVKDEFELTSSETGNKHITLKGGRNLQDYTDTLMDAMGYTGDHHHNTNNPIEIIGDNHANSYGDELHMGDLHQSENHHHNTGAPIEIIHSDKPVNEEGLYAGHLHHGGHHHNIDYHKIGIISHSHELF
jgi:hypothetical protein